MRHHDALVRTTVTLDPDVERLLKDAVHRSANPSSRAPCGGASPGVQVRHVEQFSRRALGFRRVVDDGGGWVDDALDHVVAAIRSDRGGARWRCALIGLYVVYAGGQSFELARGIKAIALARLLDDLKPLR